MNQGQGSIRTFTTNRYKTRSYHCKENAASCKGHELRPNTGKGITRRCLLQMLIWDLIWFSGHVNSGGLYFVFSLSHGGPYVRLGKSVALWAVSGYVYDFTIQINTAKKNDFNNLNVTNYCSENKTLSMSTNLRYNSSNLKSQLWTIRCWSQWTYIMCCQQVGKIVRTTKDSW